MTWAVLPKIFPGPPATTRTIGQGHGQVVGSGFKTPGCRETEAVRAFASVAPRRPVSLGGDSASPDEELAVCTLSPSVPHGDFQFSWLIQSPFPAVTEVLLSFTTSILGVVLRPCGYTDTPVGATLCFGHLWTPVPP